MYNHTDFRQVVGEVKERNRIHMALSKIREIAMTINPDDISDDVRESLMLIIKECDDTLKPKNNSQIIKLITKRISLK